MVNPEQYGKDILSGKIAACEYVRQSVQRHFDDLEKDWEFYFSPDEGMRPVNFFMLLRHWRGEFYDKPFVPEPWQAWVLYVFYGWKKKSDHKRRFKYMYIEVPRKNGKTTFVAGCSLFHMLMDGENAPEVFFTAIKEAQARLCLKEAQKMAGQTPQVRKRLKILKYWIEYPEKNGHMLALGGDSDKQFGLNPSMVVLDEVHSLKDWGMFDVMDTALGMRAQPSLIMITTAGLDRSYPCYEYRQKCIEVLKGNKQEDDLLPMIYTLDKDDDWEKEESWIKANPSWGIMYQEKFINDAIRAQKFVSSQRPFKNFRLNIWTDVRDVWMGEKEWNDCAVDPPKEDHELVGLPCWAGADFAETRDLCALALNFKLADGRTYAKFYFWIPDRKVKEKEDIVDYLIWKKLGYINVIGGDAINHEDLAVEVMELLVKYKVQGMTYDKYGIGEATIQSMINRGYSVDKLHPIKQNTTFFQGPIVTIEERIGLGEFLHDGSPVMQWNIRNTEVFYDTYGGKKFVKSKARNKIDGSVALAMSIAEELAAPEEETGNVYFL
jgi:phage terminase large subunit-like protein